MITINREAIYKEVDMTTAYIGAKADKEGSLYEHIATREEDHEKLNAFFSEAVKMLCLLCGHYLKNISEDGGDINLTLEVSHNWSDVFADKMNELVKSYVSNYIVSQWLVFVKHDEAAEYLQKTVSIGTLVKKILAERVKPIREKKHTTSIPVYLIEQHDEVRNGLKVTVIEVKDSAWWKENIGGIVQISNNGEMYTVVPIDGKAIGNVGSTLDVKITGYTEGVYKLDGFVQTGGGYIKQHTVIPGGVITIKVVKQE